MLLDRGEDGLCEFGKGQRALSFQSCRRAQAAEMGSRARQGSYGISRTEELWR